MDKDKKNQTSTSSDSWFGQVVTPSTESSSASSSVKQSDKVNDSEATKPQTDENDDDEVTPQFGDSKNAKEPTDKSNGKKPSSARGWIIGIIIVLILVFGFMAFHHGGSSNNNANSTPLSEQIKGQTFKEASVVNGKKEQNASNPKLKFIGNTKSESVLGKKVLVKNTVKVKGNQLITYRTDKIPKGMIQSARKQNKNIPADGTIHEEYAVKRVADNGNSMTFEPLYSVTNGQKSNVPAKDAKTEKTILTKD